jgi:hypothetical protein
VWHHHHHHHHRRRRYYYYYYWQHCCCYYSFFVKVKFIGVLQPFVVPDFKHLMLHRSQCSCLTHTSFITSHGTQHFLLLHVSATYCSHHQGDILGMYIYVLDILSIKALCMYIYVLGLLIYKILFFKVFIEKITF